MVRFHDELRQGDRGIKRGGLKDSDEHFRKKNKVVDIDVEMYGDGFKNQDRECNKELNSYSEENTSEMSEKTDGEESDSELSKQ